MKFSLPHRSTLAAALLLLPTAVPKIPTGTAALPRKLDIHILVTAEPEKVFHPTKGPDGKFSQPEPVKVAPKGQLVAALVYFKDCQPDTAGNCNVDVDLQGVAPGGSVFQNRKAAPLWRSVKAPGPGMTQLGSSYMKMQFERSDPAGTYRVIAVAHDRNSGAEARAEASFGLK
jgi:hypothetical protein